MLKRFILIVLLIFNTAVLYSSPLGWENNLTIVSTGGYKPTIASYRNNIFIAYIKSVIETPQVFFVSSTNEGRKWDKARQITELPSSCDTPKLIYVKDIIYLFWVDFRDGNNEIYFTYSSDSTEFEKPIRVTYDSSDSFQPFICSTGDKIILFWSDDRSGDYELFAKIFDVINKKWSDDINVTLYTGGSFYAYAISVLDDIHLVWQMKDGVRWKIMYSKSIDGEKWSKPENISLGVDNAYEPRVAYSPEGLKVIFQAEKNYELELYSNTYEEMSEHWLIPIQLTRDVNVEHSPYLVTTFQKLYAFWFDYSEGNNEIMVTSSTDAGLLWDSKLNISETKGDSHNHQVLYNSLSDNIYLVWEEDGNGTIIFKSGDKYCPFPVIVASSHKTNKWAFENNAFFKWTIKSDTSGIKDYAYILDDKFDTVPDLFVAQYPIDEAKFYDLKDGIWYFHLRARDNVGNTSVTVHYPIKINSKLYLEKVIYYVVKYGDTLWDIAEKYYKNPKLYKILVDYNQIQNPRWIHPHQIIKIPPKKAIGK